MSKKTAKSNDHKIQSALEYHEKMLDTYGEKHSRTKDSLEYVKQLQTINKGK